MIKHICECGNECVDIMSVSEKIHKHKGNNIPIAKITYICPACGESDVETHFLYKLSK